MRVRLLVFLATLMSIQLSAQVYVDKDSLWAAIARSKPDTGRARLYIQLGQQYENNNPDSALLLYEAALKLSQELNYTRGIISYYTNATYVYNLKGQYDTSLALNLRSVEIARAFGDPERMAACLGNVGASYVSLNRHEEAVDAFLKIIPLYEQLKDQSGLRIIYDNLCITYFNLRQFSKSIDYGEKGVQISRQTNNLFGITTGLINLSMPYDKNGQLSKSIELLLEAQQLARQTDNQYALLVSGSNLGDAYIKQGDFQKAEVLYESGLKLATALDDKVSIAIAYRGLSICQASKGKLNEAESNANRALQIALAYGYVSEAGKAYTTLAEISLLKKDMRSYVRYSLKSDSIQTQLLNESITRNIQSIEAKYKTEKKEQQIKDLQLQAEIDNLSLRQNRLLIFILTGAFLALLTITFLTRRTLQQKKILLEKENGVNLAKISQLETEKKLLASEAVIKGQEQERGRIAKDLHDGLGGMLSGIKFSLTNMKSNVILNADHALVFERSLDMLDHSITELRRVAHNMMPEVLVNFGLTEALKSYCESIRQSGLFKIDFQSMGTVKHLPSNTEIILYRVIQELLNNIAKHAKATQVLVQVAWHDQEISITIEDDGIGFDASLLEKPGGSGWANIRARMEYLKGKLDVQSSPGKGTSVHISSSL